MTSRLRRRGGRRLAVVAVGMVVAAFAIGWRWWGPETASWVVEPEPAMTAIGLVVGIIGVVVAVLAWLRPRSPSHERPTASIGVPDSLPARASVVEQRGTDAAAGGAPGRVAGASVVAPTGALPSRIHGRDRLLRKLDRAMRRPGSRVQVLTGLGGVGKSTVALELCRRTYERTGRRAWWISANDADSVIDGLVSLAEELRASYGVREAIRSGTGRGCDQLWELLWGARPGWLLVFDNADDLRVLGPANGTGWLRGSDRGLVLVTSRIREARLWGSQAQVRRVDPLSKQAAARVLIDAAPRAGAEADARILARRLGYLPLPLHLAGTNLGSEFARWNTFAAFTHALDTVGIADVLATDTGPGQDEDPRTRPMETWELSLDSLTDGGIPQARPLLRMLSCYAALTPIPLSLLQLAGVAALAGSDRPPHTDDVPQWVGQGLRGLARLSLIGEQQRAGNPTDRAVVVHPVVAETNRAHLDAVAQANPLAPDTAVIRRTAVDLIAAAVEVRTDDNRHWPTFAALVPHVRELLRSTAAHLDNDDLARLLTITARLVAFQAWSGAEYAGERLGHSALAHADRLDADHPARLYLRNELAWAIGRNDRWAEAEPALRQILDQRTRVLGADHVDTLDTRHKLAWTVGKLGDWAAAEASLSAVCDVRARVLGAEHPDTLHTRCCHAWAISQCGRLADAAIAYQDVIEVRTRVLGEDHIETLDARHSLAEALVTHGRHADGEVLFREVITSRARILGPDHPETMDSRPRYWLACALRGQGRHHDADREFRRLLADQERTLGPDHPATRATRCQLE